MASFPKREINKAQTRMAVLQALYRLSETIDFRALKVSQLAKEAGVTEMTFFNYFKRKEEILAYMMGVWSLELEAVQLREPLQGEAAIRRLFAHTAAQAAVYPRLMAGFVAALVNGDIAPVGVVLHPADRYLIFPDLPALQTAEIADGNMRLLHHLQEMRPGGEHTQTLLRLASAFYGDVVVAQTAQLSLERLYQTSLDAILQSV